MTLDEYEKKQVALAKYEEYMVNEIQQELSVMDIETLEEVMEHLNIYNRHKGVE